TQYSYDKAHELTSVLNPQGYQSQASYDPAGQLTSTTNFNGQVTNYSYNLAGWRTGETWLNGLGLPTYQATYTFDDGGAMTGASDPFSAYSTSYDGAGRFAQQTVTYPGLAAAPLVSLTYSYDPGSMRTSLNDSLGGSITYSYNGNRQATGMTLSVGGTGLA